MTKFYLQYFEVKSNEILYYSNTKLKHKSRKDKNFISNKIKHLFFIFCENKILKVNLLLYSPLKCSSFF
jgi:hypothetical protein